MPTLSITEFSCLKDVRFELMPVNVIIGPQGSGKSVTTKLFYYFADIFSSMHVCAERGDSIEEFKSHLSRQFTRWFPASAWGAGRFNITYTAGSFSARVLRKRVRGLVSDDVTIKFSEWFVDYYGMVSSLYGSIRSNADEPRLDRGMIETFEIDYRTRLKAIDAARGELKGEFLDGQTFIPAGRAFFTSIGRLVAGLENASSLDPVTMKFAKLFANLRDRGSQVYFPSHRKNGLSDGARLRKEIMERLFGGTLVFQGDNEYVQTSDGRKIPFNALSSGQQKLLPMWSIMDYLGEVDEARTFSSTRPQRWRELVYIEEPEAHLFPSAQSLLMDFLIGSVTADRKRRSLIITTHSPYIMSKLNIYLKAGAISRRKKKNLELAEIIPRNCWLNEVDVAAYAITDGGLTELIDDDGLIDGDYLDGISDQLSEDYSRLLDLEASIK